MKKKTELFIRGGVEAMGKTSKWLLVGSAGCYLLGLLGSLLLDKAESDRMKERINNRKK